MSLATASFLAAAQSKNADRMEKRKPLQKRYGPIQRVLIANRGEIAVRIIKTCRAMGLTSIAVFSEADRDALFVQLADEATCIGPAASLESYLSMDNILAACHRMRADAVHPGYGFLSENGEFSDRCAAEGIIFIGPDGKTMDSLGNKLAVKQRLQAESPEIPLIPGYNGQDQSAGRLAAEAKQMGQILPCLWFASGLSFLFINLHRVSPSVLLTCCGHPLTSPLSCLWPFPRPPGFPVLLKAAAGGGGKGMRVVNRVEELEDAISAVKSEALNGFGNDELLVEKYFGSCRHIEVQIFGDFFGNVVHFGERDCSLQRRHQKVIEESPSPFMTPELRARMGAAAVAVGRLCNYVGAGTVEFLVDENRKFYFLEVNTRLQVEHPVTELIQGLDFVALQIQIAQGKRLDTDLGVTPDRHRPHPKITHAMECRIYAEDPTNNFFPCTGQLLRWAPFPADGVRYDSGVVSGSVIGIHYDPMIAKVITYGSSREEVLQRMIRALQQSVILGMVTNKAFLLALLTDPNFVAGQVDTRYLDRVYTAERRSVIQRSQLRTRELLQDLAVGAWLWEWQLRNRKRRLLRHIPAGFSNGGLRWTESVFRLKSRAGAGTAEREIDPEVR